MSSRKINERRLMTGKHERVLEARADRYVCAEGKCDRIFYSWVLSGVAENYSASYLAYDSTVPALSAGGRYSSAKILLWENRIAQIFGRCLNVQNRVGNPAKSFMRVVNCMRSEIWQESGKELIAF
jgi:hypothetical protein